MYPKFVGKVTKIKGVTSRKRSHICKSASLQFLSPILSYGSTLLLIMQIIKNKNETGGH